MGILRRVRFRQMGSGRSAADFVETLHELSSLSAIFYQPFKVGFVGLTDALD